MSGRLVLDIETVPLEAALAAPYPKAERAHPSNYKDPEKIAAWYERDEAEWREARVKECSLNPRLGRVLCIGISGLDDKQARKAFDMPSHPTTHQDWVSLLANTEGRETVILHDFWTLVAWSDGRIIGFNSRTFDLRFLVLRSLALGIQPTIATNTIRAWFAKYRVIPHCDVRDLLTNWDSRESGTLSEWCRFVGVPYENGHTGADIYQLYRDGKFSEIAAKCGTDVAATRSLYEKVARMFAAEAA